MATPPGKLPPAQAEKARLLEAAMEAYLQDMSLLKKERREIIKRFMQRIEAVKIEETKKRLQSL